MADVNITYKGASIATMDASGTKTLETGGKFCEDDIDISYTKPSSGITPSGTKQIIITANGSITEDVTNYASAAITVDVPSQSVNAYVAEVTVATHTAANVALCTLPDAVYAHKDDTNFAVMLLCTDSASLVNGDDIMVMATNNGTLAVA